MAKVNFKNKKSLKLTKNKLYGSVSFSQMKDGRVIAKKWPAKKSKSLAKKIYKLQKEKIRSKPFKKYGVRDSINVSLFGLNKNTIGVKSVENANSKKPYYGKDDFNLYDADSLDFLNKVYFKDARKMDELPNNSVNLIVTSPPYFNIKDYSLDGYQKSKRGEKIMGQIGDIVDYKKYIEEMLGVWQECDRVLKPNGKLVINTPLMPMLKRNLNTHCNRHIFNINSDIESSIINNLKLFLLDVYIWNRTNPSKRLMFGSYPYPRNFYAQNTIEFITVYVKDGPSENILPRNIKESSKLTEKEWVEFTKQIWNIPIPGKGDLAFGEHSALMPEEIVRRCVRLYTYVNDVVLDPFAGSGTTLKVAKELKRNFVGYEISKNYEKIINLKLNTLI